MSDKFKDDTFLARWLAGELSDEEKAAFEAQDDFKLYQKIADASAELQPPARDKEQGWANLQKEMTSPKVVVPLPNRRRRIQIWSSVAAVALLLIIAYFTFIQGGGQQIISAPLAGQELIRLPDGSEVRLNASSQLTYSPDHFLNDRRLELDGEAYFEVKKGSQFTVQTRNGDVRVLGTRFNVQARNNKVEVTCFSGRVGVSFDQFETMTTLDAGKRVLGIDQKIVRESDLNRLDSLPAWTQGESRFSQTPYSEVIEELERQYNIEIQYPAELGTVTYNGGFPHQNLQAALKIVFPTAGYQFEIKGRQIRVFK